MSYDKVIGQRGVTMTTTYWRIGHNVILQGHMSEKSHHDDNILVVIMSCYKVIGQRWVTMTTTYWRGGHYVILQGHRSEMGHHDDCILEERS